MGFRSNFITENMGYEIPVWFIDEYPHYAYSQNTEGKKTLAFAQLYESKFYLPLKEDKRFTDIQKVLQETKQNELVVILLHECGGITRVKITQDSITAREPKIWKEVNNVEHSYCYGCSDKTLETNNK
jgi:hypothetical protein